MTTNDTTHERVTATFRHVPGLAPGTAASSLKRLLKCLGRYYGWRCESIAPGAPGGAPETPEKTVGKDGKAYKSKTAKVANSPTVSPTHLRFNSMGPQRFSRIQISDVQNFAAAGSTQADATLLRSAVNNVTGADGTKGVRMPPVVAPADHFRPPGTLVIVHNESSSNLKLYPHVGGSINGGAANAAITIPANTMRWLIALTSTNYGLMLT
jgi:hypothetical protein